MTTRFFSVIILMNLLWAAASPANVLVAPQNSSTTLAYTGQTSSTDLINAGQSTLASTTVSTTFNAGFGPGGINDGDYSSSATNADNTFFTAFPATATYNLNVSVNTLGYDLTSIKSFMGWANASAAQGNQTYTIEFRVVGSATYNPLTTVSFKPFSDVNLPAYESLVTVSEDTSGVLATGVDSIRFTFTNPIGATGVPSGTGSSKGTVIREIDVFGTPTTGTPVSPTKLVITAVNGGANPTVGTPFAVVVQAQDAGGTPRSVTAATAVSLSLKTGTGTLGGTLNGTIAAGTQSATISGVTYSKAEGGVILTATRTGGDTLTAGDSAAFTVDAVGASIVTIASPTSRHIVQRSSGNSGTIKISGSYTAAPESVEARAVVMAGAGNSGTTTSWQTIQASPTGGNFAGSLTAVPAGGWYQLEVRAVAAGSPGTAATVAKVGVGDIYVTAGQSNSANHGSPASTPADDRVSTRTAVSTATWRHAYDRQPLATGSGGSVWSRLGDQLAAAENLPIGFICVGQGSTQVSQWVPGTSNYDSRLKPAIQSLGAAGFRAVLWHQGESDALANVTAATHAAGLNSMIGQSRTDAGWAVPWYLAEASFHPSSALAAEEPVVAGQRAVIFGDAQVFAGPVTDNFHQEGKLSDSVHFNAAGLLDHATQWAAILSDTPPLTPKNADFESNTALADGGMGTIDTASTSSPSVIGWRALNAANTGVADGFCGYYNPDALSYPNTADGGANGGVIPGMTGRHVAFLMNSSADACFLQTRRAALKAKQTYTLTAAIGVRSGVAVFGGAKIELLADGVVLASRTMDRSGIDALHGGDATGTFTDVAMSHTTGGSAAAGQSLAIRITKPGGAATYLDFDNVRLTATSTPYASWQVDHFGSTTADGAGLTDNPDADSFSNVFEYHLGLDPLAKDAPAVLQTITDGAGKVWNHYEIPLDPSVDSSTLGLWYSFDLLDWFPAANDPGGTVVESRAVDRWSLDVSSADHPRAFFQLRSDPSVR